MKTAREFVGGPFHGETRVVDDTSLAVNIRVDSTPPRWARYELQRDDTMKWVSDYDSVFKSIEAALNAAQPQKGSHVEDRKE